MNSQFMTFNKLKTGDTITLELGDKLFEQNAALGAVAVVPERYPDSFTCAEFKIVGAYRDVDPVSKQASNIHWSYSANTVFIPLSFLPVEIPEDHIVKPGEISFIIDDPRNINTFISEALPVIKDDLGLTLYLNDRGWLEIESQLDQAHDSALAKMLLLSLSYIVAVCLTVYMFVLRKRKEYGIMRALGTPRRIAGRGLYFPLGTLAVIALVAGNMLASTSVDDAITNSVILPLAELGIVAEAFTPPWLAPVCILSGAAIQMLAASYGIVRIGRKPALELLHGNAGRSIRSARNVRRARGRERDLSARRARSARGRKRDLSARRARSAQGRERDLMSVRRARSARRTSSGGRPRRRPGSASFHST